MGRDKLAAVLVAASVLAAGVLTPRDAAAELMITVDKSTQRMTVAIDGAQKYVWPVSTGRAGHHTPAGSFTPFRLEADHYSKEWDDAPMPHSIFFTKQGHAIHGSYNTRQLGAPASAGCVRLAPANAALLFSLVKQHGLGATKVSIGGDETLVARRGGRGQVASVDRPRNSDGVEVWPNPFGSRGPETQRMERPAPQPRVERRAARVRTESPYGDTYYYQERNAPAPRGAYQGYYQAPPTYYGYQQQAPVRTYRYYPQYYGQ